MNVSGIWSIVVALWALASAVSACGNFRDFVRPHAEETQEGPTTFTLQSAFLVSPSLGMRLDGDGEEQKLAYLAAIEGGEFALLRLTAAAPAAPRQIELVYFGTARFVGNELKTTRLFDCRELGAGGGQAPRDFYFRWTESASGAVLHETSIRRLLPNEVFLERRERPAALAPLRAVTAASLELACPAAANGSPRDDDVPPVRQWLERAAQLFD